VPVEDAETPVLITPFTMFVGNADIEYRFGAKEFLEEAKG
jgi:hypothetical protein